MISKTFDSHVPPVNADDAFDDSDVDLLSVECVALLDVQLEIGCDVSRFLPTSRSLLGSPPMNLIPSRIVLPLRLTRSSSFSVSSPSIARLPINPPSSF